MSAKQETMRVLRLATLIAVCLAVTACGTTTATTPTPAPASTAATATSATVASRHVCGSDQRRANLDALHRCPPRNRHGIDSGQRRGASSASQDGHAAAATTLVVDSDNSTPATTPRSSSSAATCPPRLSAPAGRHGSIVFGPDGAIAADQSQIQVDLSKLSSDESRRDNFIKGSTLQTSRFPNATFVPTRDPGPTHAAADRRSSHVSAARRPDRPRRHQARDLAGDRSVRPAQRERQRHHQRQHQRLRHDPAQSRPRAEHPGRPDPGAGVSTPTRQRRLTQLACWLSSR